MSVHFMTFKMDPIGWGKAGQLVGQEVSYPRNVPATPSPVVVVVYFEWGCPISVVCRWDKSEDELLKLTEKPKKLINWAFRNMDSEHSDALDNHLSDDHEGIYINGREVQIE